MMHVFTQPALELVPILGQAAGGAPAGGGFMSSFGMMGIILAIFYFLLIRPQQKEARQHQELLAGLQKGDRVVTSSGLHGRVFGVEDAEVVVEIADKVRVTIDKTSVKRKIPTEA